ncbi:MAG: DUF6178 family protein [Thermodesulfobacteriaceae bacterium]|nr:DUF6178 family protein [Thermodesulfobacteriaceae bacterium]
MENLNITNPLLAKKLVSTKFDLEYLLNLSEKEIEKFLATLNFYDSLDLILSTPWEKRAKLILLSPFSEALVKNLSNQELFLTLKASSLDLVVELLSYAKGTQIQFLLDLDTWYKDRIKPERVLSWIYLLFHAGEDKVLEWLKVADWDYLIAIFQKFIKVYKRPDEVDLLEAMDFLPPYTLDDFYFIDFKNPEYEFYFRRMIEIIREEMSETYFSLMESIIWELPLEVEERAYRWRNSRLADEGILDYFEALEIYSYLHPKSLKKIEINLLPYEEEKIELSPTNIVLYAGEEDLFIFRVLTSIEETFQLERIKRELAWLVSKVIIVDHIVIDEIEQVKESLEKVWGSLNLGLEYLSSENLELAKRFLKNHFLEDIFKVGQTALRELRKLAINIAEGKEFDPTILKYLDQPYQGYLQGVLTKKLNRIKLFQPKKIGTLGEYTYFKRVSEVRLVRRYLEEVGYIAPLLQKTLGTPSDWIKEITQPGRNFDSNFLSWSSLILTALANWINERDFRFKALPKSSWDKVFKNMIEKRGGLGLMKEEIKTALFENFKKFAQNYWYLEPELLSSFLNFVIQKWEEEFKYSDPDNPPDSLYQTLVLIDLKK